MHMQIVTVTYILYFQNVFTIIISMYLKVNTFPCCFEDSITWSWDQNIVENWHSPYYINIFGVKHNVVHHKLYKLNSLNQSVLISSPITNVSQCITLPKSLVHFLCNVIAPDVVTKFSIILYHVNIMSTKVMISWFQGRSREWYDPIRIWLFSQFTSYSYERFEIWKCNIDVF